MKANCINPEWHGRAKCSACDIRNSVLFSGLTTVELDAILQPIDNLHVPQSAVLYDQYGAAPYVYTVRSGMLKLRVDLPNGGQRAPHVSQQADDRRTKPPRRASIRVARGL